jgi:hypothetical protein
MISLSADWRDEVISPGPLTSHHAQLLHPSAAPAPSTGNCLACHGAAERSAASWAASLIGLHGAGPNQSQRCLTCHDASIAIEHALDAHNVPPQQLRQLTQGARGANNHQVACAACHREHQGGQFDLTAMDNAACQSCHQRRYESFATDHPDFGRWPYVRRTRIAFNHASHKAKHFVENQQVFDCRRCHLDDSTSEVQLLANYEAACASCHDEQIATSVANGVAMLAVPTLDIDSLQEAGHDIGAWPAAATGDFDGRLPAPMKLLLASDPAAAEAMSLLGADCDFFDVDPEDPQQLKACATLAVAIKRLFADVSHAGPWAVRERLRITLQYDVPASAPHALLSGLSAETIRGAAAGWFGISNSREDRSADRPSTAVSAGSSRAPALGPAGVWERDDTALAIRYRPAAHADPVLTAWLELLAAAPDLAKQPPALAIFKELSDPSAPGTCASCHSIEETAAGRLAINWRAYDRATAPRGLARFAHGPHLILPQLADCSHCHAINESRSVAKGDAGWNPQRFVSEFAPLTKQQCVDCHTAQAAGDRCQQCHNYHVEQIESWRLP